MPSPKHRAPKHRADRQPQPRPGRNRLTGTLAAAATVAVVATGTLAGTTATAETATAGTCTSNFRDVPRSSHYHSAVTWANCQGISKGYANGTYGVKKSITRGEVATMLYRQTTPKHPKNGQQYFRDVPKGKFYTEAVNWMAQSGLSKGYGNRMFKPNQPITRGEVSALVYRLAGANFPGRATSPFRDMTKSSGFYKEATWMLNHGLASGYSNWTFRPAKAINRGEMAIMLKNSNRFVAHRGDVTTSKMTPLSVEVERASSTTATWKNKAADWATAKATNSKTYYQWGGNGPYGYDCSGFTTGAFSAGGKSLPRTAKSQYTAADQHVPRSQAKKGDLVYWSNNGQASGVYHVAIVVDGGKIAHARNPSVGVTVTDIDYSPWNMLPNAGRFD